MLGFIIVENLTWEISDLVIIIIGVLLIAIWPLINLILSIIGGFTTFSTFALETTDLIKGGHMGIAFLYAVLSVFIGFAVVFGIDMLEMGGR